MDEKDRLLLTYLHNGVPLVERPFGVLAEKTGVDGAEILVRIQRLMQEGLLTGVRAVFDFRMFHYQSSWVAMRFESSELDANTEIILQHPGVIYACERDHDFNFWFYLAVPAGHDLELHVRCLEKLSGAKEALLLPVRKVLKGTDLLSVLDAVAFPEMGEHYEKRQKICPPELTKEEMEIIFGLQEPFPLTDEPFRKIAREVNLPEAKVFDTIKVLVQKGFLRRIGSFSRTPAAGFPPKTLVVWQIPEEKLERIENGINEFEEVLYGDRRPSYPGFPHSLYTMIRAGNAAELEVVTRRIQDKIGKWPHRVLETVRELKKTGMKYFPKGLDVWWEQSRHMVETVFQ